MDTQHTHLLSMTACRPSTASVHVFAVEQVIIAMREHLDACESLSLHEMADIAGFSPYHFDRIFRFVTGVSPTEFLAALRLDMAKRLLLTQALRVIDVSFDVGYTSQGTFTRRFTQFVGLAPNHFRLLAESHIISSPDVLLDSSTRRSKGQYPQRGLSGSISMPDHFGELIFVGLFLTRIPQGPPVACAALTHPGSYHIANVPDGRYYVLAAAFPWSSNPLDYLLPSANVQIGTTQAPIRMQHGQAIGQANVMLRQPRVIDPPLVVALPALLAEPTKCATRLLKSLS
jgi:AraC family transcriptional regulator